MRSKSYLARLYCKEGLSQNAIGKRLGVARTAVGESLKKLGLLAEKRNRDAQSGRIPFGSDYIDGKLVRNLEELKTIRMMKQLKGRGESLRGIANELNARLIPTKNNGVWQANTVRKILARV